MRRAGLLVSILVLALGAGAGTASATHSPLAAAEVLGKAGGAQYALFIPHVWNGDLVVYAHGYVDPEAPVVLPDVSPAIVLLRETVLGLGFGIAYSSYPTNGYAVKDGAQRTHQLRDLFASRFGRPGRTYLVGHSLGASIVQMLAERHPEQYDGALPMCGPVGGAPSQIRYIADVRVVFDVLFPGVIPGDALHVPPGLPYASPGLIDAIVAAMSANPTAALALAAVDQVDLPFTTFSELVESAVRALFYNVRGTNDLLDRTHGGSPFDNTGTVYTGLGLFDPVLNALADRFAADRQALKYLEKYYQPSGGLEIPVLTLHTIMDPEVPFFHEAAYAGIVAAAGASDLLVQQHVTRYGHCRFTPVEQVNAFLGLVTWVVTGVKPPGGDVTLP